MQMSFNIDQSNPEIEELMDLLKNLLNRIDIGSHDNENLGFLQNETFYFDVFTQMFDTEMFPSAEVKHQFKKMNAGARIQFLIDFLAQNVLQIDLEHINGFEIQNGNIIHIKNFLQLILALIDSAEEEPYEGSSLEDQPPSGHRQSQSAGKRMTGFKDRGNDSSQKPAFEKEAMGESAAKKEPSEKYSTSKRKKKSAPRVVNANKIDKPEMRISVLDKIESDIEEYQRANPLSQSDRKAKENKLEENKKINSVSVREDDLKSKREVANKLFSDLEHIELSKSKETTPKTVLDTRNKLTKLPRGRQPKEEQTSQLKKFVKKEQPEQITVNKKSNFLNRKGKLTRTKSAAAKFSRTSKEAKSSKNLNKNTAIIETTNSKFILKDLNMINQDELATLLAKNNQKYQNCLNDFAFTLGRKSLLKSTQKMTMKNESQEHLGHANQIFQQKFDEKVQEEIHKHQYRIAEQQKQFTRAL